ncbi:MAG: phospho-N-acetylmuramoyl-pentapeptide-transferase [Bacteroidetes bacterium]|nr:MAG: phospho-N-acetylmuramoyl-pentapeptide-transferase [Bacteroidota bacterium]
MFYHLFEYLKVKYDLVGAGLFQYISFRAGMTTVLSLIITVAFGKRLISYLQRKQVGEKIRDLGLEGQAEKAGTPTMGGIIIILGIVVPTLLFARLDNVYIILLLVSTLWLGLIGFADDYIKVFKNDKEGLRGWFKIIGQVGLGLIVGLTLYFNENVVVREFDRDAPVQELLVDDHPAYEDVKSTKTTIPFFKGNEADYSNLNPFDDKYTWIIYVLIVIFIITAVSNGANLTDGMDGLAAGTTAIIALTLGVLAYVSGRVDFTNYLNIMYIPNSGELFVFSTALVGATVGFLWFNSFPAQVFMGDTGSLALGGVVAVFALIIRKELLIPLLCGIFLIEVGSVILQVSYFKYTKKKFGEGKRIFLMSPLHHHYQKQGIPEPKIVTRFWIMGIMLAILTLATLKIR